MFILILIEDTQSFPTPLTRTGTGVREVREKLTKGPLSHDYHRESEQKQSIHLFATSSAQKALRSLDRLVNPLMTIYGIDCLAKLLTL